jgi:hypothetical protein
LQELLGNFFDEMLKIEVKISQESEIVFCSLNTQTQCNKNSEIQALKSFTKTKKASTPSLLQLPPTTTKEKQTRQLTSSETGYVKC